ncbi:hypothetical protein EVAR_93190_1 [Eumeta japonica]|uniref:Uncharacterized protein n=1 Tax=Eumeta variegata TaxID=151549 RepID=A0A4C1TXJ1_EUMVA|nr:hypothetical protein EVAR_93190_1 [Eumeta japonica]
MEKKWAHEEGNGLAELSLTGTSEAATSCLYSKKEFGFTTRSTKENLAPSGRGNGGQGSGVYRGSRLGSSLR